MYSEIHVFKRIAVPQQFGWVFLRVVDILAVEAARSYCTFHCHPERRITVSRSLAWAEEQLRLFGFLRAHRSWLVNLHYVEEFSRKEGVHLKLSNGLDVPVSAMYRDQLLGQLVDNYTLAPVDGNGHWGGQIRHWEDGKGE
jgi:two-component system LytT family response regulator